MMSLEMIGYFSDADNSQKFSLPLMEFFIRLAGISFLWSASLVKGSSRAGPSGPYGPALLLASIPSTNAPSFVTGIAWSDHYYWQTGYPAVMITDTSLYRHADYHTENYRPDTLGYRRMAMLAQAVLPRCLRRLIEK